MHYINDPERGAVWEETLMHLSGEVQLVALSATLRRPEDFVAWISSARGRAGEIVVTLMCLYIQTYMSIYLSICVPIYLSMYVSISLSLSLSIYIYIYIYI